MSEQVREHFEMPKEMRSMAEASFGQARRTVEKFLENAQAAAGSFEARGATVRAGARDVGAKAVACAERNMNASLDFADSLVHAKDLSEMMRLQGEFIQTQMRLLAQQASEMSQIVSRTAMEAAQSKI